MEFKKPAKRVLYGSFEHCQELILRVNKLVDRNKFLEQQNEAYADTNKRLQKRIEELKRLSDN